MEVARAIRSPDHTKYISHFPIHQVRHRSFVYLYEEIFLSLSPRMARVMFYNIMLPWVWMMSVLLQSI